MTSTIFSGKSFSPLFKLAWRRNKPVLMTYSVLMGLGIVIDLYVMSLIARDSTMPATLAEEYSSVGMVSIIIAQGGAMVFTLISALLTFSFLHNKRTADMYGSMPTTRTTLYVSHLFGGFAAAAAPFVVGSLIVMGVTARTGFYIRYDLMSILLGLLGMAAAYLLTAIVAYGCGTTVDTLVITVAVNVIYAGTVGVFWGMISEMIPGISMEEMVSTPVITLFAPFAFCFFGDFYHFQSVEDYMYNDGSRMSTALIVLLVWTVAFIAALFFLGLAISRKRKAEISQNGFAANWLPAAVKIGGSVVCGMIAGMVAGMSSYSGYANMFSFVFWYILIGFAAFFILHIILNRGVKGGRFIPSFIAYVAATVVCVGLVFAFTGGMGLDTYVPKAGNVSSVEFDYVTYRDPKNIENITKIHKIITEGVREENDYPYYIGSSNVNKSLSYVENYAVEDYTAEYAVSEPYETGDEPSESDVFSKKYPLVDRASFNFRYKKKVGFVTRRDYYMWAGQSKYYDFGKIEPLLAEIYNSEEYKRSRNETIWKLRPDGDFVLSQAPTITYLSYRPSDSGATYYNNNYYEMGVTNLPTDEAFIEGLYENLQLDILADDMFYKSLINYGGNEPSEFLGKTYLQLNVRYKRPSDKVYGDLRNYYNTDVYVDIPASYENTIKYLKDNGIATEYSSMYGDIVEITPEDIIRSNDMALDRYLQFGNVGAKGDLDVCIDLMSESLELTAYIRTDDFEDIDKWDEKHGSEFKKRLNQKLDELYEKYSSDPVYASNPDYSNEIMRENDYSGDYFYLADTILDELDKEAVNIVRELSK